MAIEITKRPFYYCWSGNPVHYELYSAQAALDATNFFEVKVLFKPIGGVYTETEVFQFSPVDGFAEVDIADILEGFLEYSLPTFDNPATPKAAEGHTGYFYLKFREITSLNSNPTWDDSELDFACLGVKGGISHFKYQGNNYWVNYFDADTPFRPRPFLTWQQSGRLASLEERMYLAYLLIDDYGSNSISVRSRSTYTDGTSGGSVVQPLAPDINKVYYIPAGFTQLGLPTVKQVWYWDIWVFEENSGDIMSEVFRFYADNRNDYNDITLNYRNSLSGLDSVRIRGVIKFDWDYDYQELQKTVRPDYFDGHFFDPQKIISNNKELQTLRGDIGHVRKEEQDRLRDAFLKRETWWAIAEKWWPVNIVNKTISPKTTENTRWSLPLDFTLAHDGDYNYTPDSVDIGTGVFTSNVCKATLTPLVIAIDLSGSDALITLNGTEVDPQTASDSFRWRVLEPGGAVSIGWTTNLYADLPIQFHLAKDFVFTLEVQSICTNNIYGKRITSQIDTNPPTGGGGGGGGSNSIIMNQTSLGTPFQVDVNGVTVASGYVGANNSQPFNVADTSGATVEVMLPFVSPSTGKLFSNSILYTPSGIAGNVITFDNVDIVSGMVIQFF